MLTSSYDVWSRPVYYTIETSISEQSNYRWRKECGGLKLSQAKRFKEPKKENQRLKRLVAELSLVEARPEKVTKGS
jgi:putative transposase